MANINVTTFLISSGSFNLANDTLTCSSTFTQSGGTFTGNTGNISATTYSLTAGIANMGSGTWTATSTGTVWSRTSATINANTSTILLSDATTTAKTFAGGGATYYNLVIGGAAGAATYTFTGANIFNTISDLKTAAYTITLPSSTTTTVNNWTASGVSGNVLTLNASTVSTQATLSINNQTSDIDYLTVQDIISNLAPVTFYAGANTLLNGTLGVAATTPTVGQSVYVLTSGTSFTTPADWNNNNNVIHLFGGGGGGSGSHFLTPNAAGGAGGGGGGYTKLTNINLSGTVNYQIGTGGVAGTANNDGYPGATTGILSTGFSSGSAYFNANNYLTTVTTSLAAFGTSNFTVEYWIYPTSFKVGGTAGTASTVIDARSATGSTIGYSDNFTTAGKFGVYYASAQQYLSGNTIPLNTWTHIAVVRRGTTANATSVYINGTLDGTFTSSTNFSDATTVKIGNNTNSGTGASLYPFEGYISNLRINKTTAVYTTNFTPNTTNLTAITGTSLLTLQSPSAISDASTNATTFTNIGGVTTYPNNPFNISMYTYTANGGGGGISNTTISQGGTGGTGSTYNGGAGGSGSKSTVALTGNGGGGGGGAGGPLGVGGAGGNGFASTTQSSVAAGGGGGNGGGSAGGNASSGVGGTGGNNNAGSGGATGVANAYNGGGSGGAITLSFASSAGTGTDISGVGMGGGGGLGGSAASSGANSRNAGYFGGGGGGGGVSVANVTNSGADGTQGGIILVYSTSGNIGNFFLMF
jgi:hypothetical protein